MILTFRDYVTLFFDQHHKTLTYDLLIRYVPCNNYVPATIGSGTLHILFCSLFTIFKKQLGTAAFSYGYDTEPKNDW